MRTVKQLPAGTPIETDLSLFPDSTVINETDTDAGTPVVREIYGDILVNLYKLLRITKVTANAEEDNETNGYQLIEALQKLPSIYGSEQQLNLTGTVFSVVFDLSILPDKYICIVKPVDDYVSGSGYTFKGSDNNPLAFTSTTGFAAGDEVLLVIDQGGVRAYSLNFITGSIPEIFNVFGNPLAFNDSKKIWYQSEGILFSDKPEAYDLQASIRTAAGDGTLLVYEMLLLQGYVLCLVFAPGTLQYSFYRFAIGSLGTALPIALTGSPFPSVSITDDYQPYIYTDGEVLWITNMSDHTANDYQLNHYAVNMVAGTITAAGSISINAAFQKTTNAVIVAGYLYTFINGVIMQYNLSSGVMTYGAAFPGYVGLLFGFNGGVYYSNGEVGKKWTLQVYS